MGELTHGNGLRGVRGPPLLIVAAGGLGANSWWLLLQNIFSLYVLVTNLWMS